MSFAAAVACGCRKRQSASGGDSLKILMFAQLFHPAVAGGGPVRALTNLAVALARDNDVYVIASNRDIGSTGPLNVPTLEWTDFQGAKVMYIDMRSTRQFLAAVRQVRPYVFDVVLLNSIWNKLASFAPAALIGLGVIRTRETILSPHGELEPSALAERRSKKALSRPLVRMVYRRAFTAVAATSESEGRNAREFFGDCDVLLTTNLPDDIEFSEGSFSGDVVRLLSIGRIHPIKGLLELADALSLTTQRFELSIAGFVEDDEYWQRCVSKLNQMPASIEWNYLGQVSRAELPALLAETQIVVSLTAGENFGYTIVEGLQAGCSVLATDRTPWTNTLKGGGGWVIEDRGNASEVAEALDRAAQEIRADPLRVRRQCREAFEEWLAKAPANPVEQLREIRHGR